MNNSVGPLLTALLLLVQPQKVQAQSTVGEMLKQAGRGGQLNSGQKGSTNLPSFSPSIFKDRDNRRPVNLNAVKPPKSRAFMAEDDDKAKLERITDQQIQELYKLTQKFRNSKRRGELWLRLAELYVEKAALMDIVAQDRFEARMQDYNSGKIKKRPKLDQRASREYNRKAIQLYEWFARDFPRDEKMDQALFFLGYNYIELGDLKKGTRYYQRLTKEYPRSPFITESHFALGEYYFEKEKWKQAQEHYRQVLRVNGHRLFAFSLYKSAWCSFRSGQSKQALKDMERLVRLSQSSSQMRGATRLESEGLRDIVLIYADVGSQQRAIDYFTNLAKESALIYIESLAYYYGDLGQREGSRRLFEYLIDKNPTAAKAFEYKYQIVKSYSTATKTMEFKNQLQTWIRNYREGSPWYDANKSNQTLVESSRKQQEVMLSTWTLQQHQAAQKSKASFSRSLAQEGYKLFLQEFPQAANAADMHFFYGELLYDMDRYEEAAEQYRWVIEFAPKSRFYAKAGEYVALAAQRSLPKDSAVAKRVGKSLAPVAFADDIEQFVKISQWYMTKFPQSQKTIELKFRLARLYYQHNQFDQSTPMFRQIVVEHPKTKFADYSANLLLDTFSLKKDYAGLEQVAQELLQQEGFRQTSAGKEIKSILEKANFKKAQDLESKGDIKASADLYANFAKANRGSDLATTSHFNAAVNYERSGQTSKAILHYQSVLASRDAKSSDLRDKSAKNLAKLYQDNGQLELAAKAYTDLAATAKKDPQLANYHYNAALLHEVLGNSQQTLVQYEAYFARAKGKEKFEALFMMAETYRRRRDFGRAIAKYKDYFVAGVGSKERQIESGFWVYELSKLLNRSKDKKDYRSKVLGLQARLNPSKKGLGAKFAAKIKLDDAKESYLNLRSLKIPSNPARQQKVVEEKISSVNHLNRQLAEIIRFDSGEEIIASLQLLGMANQHMAESLRAAPVPSNLNVEQIKQYRAGVDKIAEPFLVKAQESLQAAVDKGTELELYTDEYRVALLDLRKLQGRSAISQSELALESRLINWMIP